MSIQPVPDPEQVDGFQIMRHQYLKETEQARLAEKQREEDKKKLNQLIQAQDSSKLPTNEDEWKDLCKQNTGFIRAVLVNEKIREQEKICE